MVADDGNAEMHLTVASRQEKQNQKIDPKVKRTKQKISKNGFEIAEKRAERNRTEHKPRVECNRQQLLTFDFRQLLLIPLFRCSPHNHSLFVRMVRMRLFL